MQKTTDKKFETCFQEILCIILTGFCASIFTLTAPTYIGECAEPHIRGMLMNAFQVMLVSGILFVYVNYLTLIKHTDKIWAKM